MSFSSLPPEVLAVILQKVLAGHPYRVRLHLLRQLVGVERCFWLSVKKNPQLRSLMLNAVLAQSEGPRGFKRIYLMGPGGVGKLCLCFRFFQDVFASEMDPNISCWDFDGWRMVTAVEGERITLAVTLESQNEFDSIREKNLIEMGKGTVLAFCFAIDDEKSFQAVEEDVRALVFSVFCLNCLIWVRFVNFMQDCLMWRLALWKTLSLFWWGPRVTRQLSGK